jgi:5-methylthioribose kinase
MSGAVELSAGNVVEYLRSAGRLPDGPVTVRALGGGISNVVLRVDSGADRFVVKQSLPRLRVPEVWEFDRSRILVERACMDALGRLLPPGSVPVVRFCDPDNFVLAMSCAPPGPIWKDELLAGRVETVTARHVGALLGALQSGAESDPTLAAGFSDNRVLVQGRTDPYHRTAAAAHPDLAAVLEADARRLETTRRTLVLGDLSPKNVVAYRDKALLLDFEVAHWGDPAFDPAFCLTHLALKALHLPHLASEFVAAAEAFWDAYRRTAGRASSPTLDADVALELGCLLLARVDGKSRAEYLTEPERAAVRGLARGLLGDPPSHPLVCFGRIGA